MPVLTRYQVLMAKGLRGRGSTEGQDVPFIKYSACSPRTPQRSHKPTFLPSARWKLLEDLKCNCTVLLPRRNKEIKSLRRYA